VTAETDRANLGRLVRETWVTWAKRQRRPKPSWLIGWDYLDADQREVDMLIGEAVAESERERVLRHLTAFADELAAEHEPPTAVCKHAEGIRLAVQHCEMITDGSDG
jgi:hypothetical protein